MAEVIATGLLAPEADDEACFATTDADGHVGDHQEQEHAPEQEDAYLYRKLVAEHGANIVRYVTRLHKNLGHPSTTVFLQVPTASGARPEVLACARQYKCPTCSARKRPDQPPKASFGKAGECCTAGIGGDRRFARYAFLR